MSTDKAGMLILGNQLFDPTHLTGHEQAPIFMCEDLGLCTYVRHHQQKIVLFLAAMREYADELRAAGFEVHYELLNQDRSQSFSRRLADFVEKQDISVLRHFEIEDHFFAEQIQDLCASLGVRQRIIQSPMFLATRSDFQAYLSTVKRPFMAGFYKRQRLELNVLLEPDGTPRGGRWSFDQDNRRNIPKAMAIPPLPNGTRTNHTSEVIDLVASSFADHWGCANDFWWPVTRGEIREGLQRFIRERLAAFGTYQDAISQRSETAFHSVLSPALNMGLLTPKDVLDCVLTQAAELDVPLNSLEGFVRQLIGWREFIRGIYHEFDERQSSANHWNHTRGLTPSWYTGTTGIPPLDHVIKRARALGWTHHISRLMVVGNLMNLSEIEPRAVYRWFMETHVDSADWVMGPNVYGMALFSDGGIFATKPYICGSNYLLKMSDFSRGPWCDVVDGLYWRFVEKHQNFFVKNHRLSMMVRTLSRLKPERKEVIFNAAEGFLDEHTVRAGLN